MKLSWQRSPCRYNKFEIIFGEEDFCFPTTLNGVCTVIPMGDFLSLLAKYNVGKEGDRKEENSEQRGTRLGVTRPKLLAEVMRVHLTLSPLPCGRQVTEPPKRVPPPQVISYYQRFSGLGTDLQNG